jgi:hypothetical protein
MSETAALAALASFCAICSLASVSGQAAFPEKRAITDAQRVSVQRLDASVVSNDSFEHWLLALVGATTKVTWEVNDCGESTGTRADTGRDLPACVAATAHLSKEREAVVTLMVGTQRRGLTGRPTLREIAIVEGNDVQEMKGLSALAARLEK